MTKRRDPIPCLILSLALLIIGCDEDSDGGASGASTPSGEQRFGAARGQISAGSAVSMRSMNSTSRFGRAGASLGQSGPTGVVAGTMSAQLRAGYWSIVAVAQDGPGTAVPLNTIAARSSSVQEYAEPTNPRAVPPRGAEISARNPDPASSPAVPLLDGAGRLVLLGSLLASAARLVNRSPR